MQIKSIAREAGSRTKMAVHSTEVTIDPVGACVGPRGNRVEKVVAELKNEKIDIIKWSADPAEFIANALNPAHVLSVFISDTEKACRVVVPDNQLSLAIGKEGQNARLAASSPAGASISRARVRPPKCSTCRRRSADGRKSCHGLSGVVQ